MIESTQFDNKKKVIEICNPCGGTGSIANKNKLDGNDPDSFTCDKCGGSGRLQKEVTITYKPYRPLFGDARSTGSYIEFDSAKKEKL